MESKRKRRILYYKMTPINKINEIEKYIKKRFNIKYKKYQTNEIFHRHFACKFVYRKICHITTYFQDNLLFNEKEEYLTQLFNIPESFKNLIKYALIYKDYVSFYCFPIITNFYFNEIVVERREAQAEQFYDVNFKETKNKKDTSKDNGIIIYSKEKGKNDNNDSESKNEIVNKNIFNKKIRNQIDLYSPDKIECSKVNTDENSYFISSTNENNMNKIIKELNNKESHRNINFENLKENKSNSMQCSKKIQKIKNIKGTKKLEEYSRNIKKNININKYNKNNNNNFIFKYDDKNNFVKNDYFKRKSDGFIKSINYFFNKKNSDKKYFCLSKNKSTINIHQNPSLQRTLNLNKKYINSFEQKVKNEKLNESEKMSYFFKNYSKNDNNKKEKFIKTPNRSLILKLNKIIKINNNIFNINIIKTKKEKSMIENQEQNYNYKIIDSSRAQNSTFRKLKNINNINNKKKSKNRNNNNNIISRNKHNSNSSRFFSTKKLYINNKIEKENSKHKNFALNKIIPNSVIRKIIVKPKTNIIDKTLEPSKYNFNNENYSKALNFSSLNNFQTYKNGSDRIINIKKKIYN